MILVSGTKRSGTSMWMQILVAGGFPYIGSEYSGRWEESIGQANPRGFYESLLRQGIFFATNPHPRTGNWLHPAKVKHHAVKVFIPGLVRTDYAYIHRVVATMRAWRAYGPSLARLYAMEDAWLLQLDNGEERLKKAKAARSSLPPHVEWFFENYDLIRDVAIRRYAVNLATYEAMLRDPEKLIRDVFEWLEQGDAEAAVRAVEPSLRTQEDPPDPEDVEPAHVELFDDLYHHVDQGKALPASLLQRMNEVYKELVEQYGALSRERGREDAEDLPAREDEV